MKIVVRSCKSCVPPERHPGCHDHCKKYKDEKAENDRLNALIKAEREKESYIIETVRAKMDDKAKHKRRRPRNT